MESNMQITDLLTDDLFHNKFNSKYRLLTENVRNSILPKILIVASFPPRQCGIATYTADLKQALEVKYENSFDVKICALESEKEKHTYLNDDVVYSLNTDSANSFVHIAEKINEDADIEIVMIQHEFGLFKNNEDAFISFLKEINKPIIIAFHTILPHPNAALEKNVKEIVSLAKVITVMTNSSRELLINTYNIAPDKIEIIQHGTHLVTHQDKSILKEKYKIFDRKVISTFGFLGPGKNIETTLDALPEIIKFHPNILFLIVGKTHPTLFNSEGEAYKNSLQEKVSELGISENVRFVNKFVPIEELLEYLQLSDCYVFTSKDPNQAVSGTFSYAVSCGCPIVSTPIPHAREVLQNNNGLLFDFGNSEELADRLIEILDNKDLRHNMKMNGLHIASSSSWENAAILHAIIFSEQAEKPLHLIFRKPILNLNHLLSMTTDVGMLQFSKINTPDKNSDYTLDDNARALIVLCQYYNLNRNPKHLEFVKRYINFILHCQRDNGLFLNYVDTAKNFTNQNNDENLEDSNGRALWALGYAYYSMDENIDLSVIILQNIKCAINEFNLVVKDFKSPRALAFCIKGWYFLNLKLNNKDITDCIKQAANKLATYYDLNSENGWNWFEPYLTYANSVLPESLLLASITIDDNRFKSIAKESFDFLLTKIFTDTSINVISNRDWLLKGQEHKTFKNGGQQPIDVAYTILALKQFHLFFPHENYEEKMEIAFSWFMGNNHLKQIIYNPCTGGCHDGLEEFNVNLNQGAESTLSYLLARLAFENY